MKQQKLSVSMVGIISCFVTLFLYCWYYIYTERPRHSNNYDFNTNFVSEKHRNLDESLFSTDSRKVNMIQTPGCQIPVAMLDYRKETRSTSKLSFQCGLRVVNLRRAKERANTVKATINITHLKLNLKKDIFSHCCYKFIFGAETARNETKTTSSCKELKHGDEIFLRSDFINVKCFTLKNTVFYDDVYSFIRKLNVTRNSGKKYNILVLGMDSMSLSRFVQTMPRSKALLEENAWNSYIGYNKVGDNTFPNIMALLTGRNKSEIINECTNNMDHCNDFIVWSSFKKQGYVTAYGEDYIRLPDTFSGSNSFKTQPTDHYMRPLFLQRESEFYNKSLVCSGKIPSGQQLLDYAFDFAVTYKLNNFFGMFWMNSFSHNVNSSPKQADNLYLNFFKKLVHADILQNTFVIFISDHGIRFGNKRLKINSYYDDRLPLLFIYSPKDFKHQYENKFKALTGNQFRLVTPYDVYNTLLEIGKLSSATEIVAEAKGCPLCHSLFESVKENRTCHDAGIHEKWCTCHNAYPVDAKDRIRLRIISFFVNVIKNTTKNIKTKSCWMCSELTLEEVVRIHYYKDQNENVIYYVIAIIMSPGRMAFEASIEKANEEMKILGPISSISPYKGRGRCTLNNKDRLFCNCQKVSSCARKT